MPHVSGKRDVEVARYPLTDLEQDALNHFTMQASWRLVQTLRGAVMIFHNLGHELWRQGMRIRIVAEAKRFCDIPECANDDPEYGTDAGGMYIVAPKLLVIREEALLYSLAANQKYRTFIHEMAHAVWYLLLWRSDQGYVTELYHKERARHPEDGSYRMFNVQEFFAESFLYYVTPYREDKILRVNSWTGFGGIPVRETEREWIQRHKEDLRSANVDMLTFLDSKFKNVIDPELVVARPLKGGDEERFDLWSGTGLYLPVIHSQGGGKISNW